MASLALARKLGLSPSAILGHVRRLEKSGAIRGAAPSSTRPRSGSPSAPWSSPCLQENSEKAIRQFEAAIKEVPGGRACYRVTGQSDMVVELALRDLDRLGQLIRVDIARIPGVMNLETMLVLAESVEGGGWPILDEK